MCDASAAPATVTGERSRHKPLVPSFFGDWEGGGQATIREPGDLPVTVVRAAGRGVPMARRKGSRTPAKLRHERRLLVMEDVCVNFCSC